MIKKNHILILGGSSDIGIETIKILLEKNWKVTAQYSSNSKKLINLKKADALKTVKLNFSKINEKNYKKILKKNFNEKYDSFLNLIGYIDNKSFSTFNLDSAIKSISINAIIPMLIIKKIISKMIKQKYGRIVNCSSIGVKFGGGEKTFNYSLSKQTLEFIPTDYKSWAKNNVFINNIRIGLTNTKLHKKIRKKDLKKRIKMIPAQRIAEPVEISKFLIWLVSNENTYIIGQTIDLSGGE